MLRAFSHDFMKQHRHAGSQQKGLFIWRNKMDIFFDNLIYIPETGILIWKKRASNRVKVGDEVGGAISNEGYKFFKLKGKTYLYHRICWLMHHGCHPSFEIDHINGNKIDNRIENLRDVNKRTNSENIRKPNSKNKTGYLGVVFGKRKGTYESYIESKGRKYFLGVFECPESAHEAYKKKKREIHYGCTI